MATHDVEFALAGVAKQRVGTWTYDCKTGKSDFAFAPKAKLNPLVKGLIGVPLSFLLEKGAEVLMDNYSVEVDLDVRALSGALGGLATLIGADRVREVVDAGRALIPQGKVALDVVWRPDAYSVPCDDEKPKGPVAFVGFSLFVFFRLRAVGGAGAGGGKGSILLGIELDSKDVECECPCR